MARKRLARRARYDPTTNGRGTLPAAPREKPGKPRIRGGEAALLERIGEGPRRVRTHDPRGRVLTARQRWF